MNAPSGMEGQVLAGKYRIERVLGQGGMGIVLAAKHIHLEERVAVKLMLAEAALSVEAVARFLREARAAARLESAHVARVTDVGTLEDGRPYMVMEYLDGSDLSQVLSAAGRLAIGDAVDYVLQAAEAIAEAHSIGIVHRDLKPSNLFLTRRRDRTPHVKVLDFGISKVSGTGSDNAMTRTSAMMGSPLYMSPEQMTSVRDVDGRSDIWALGIILYELISGTPPFSGETLPQVCALVLQSEALPLSSRRGDVPPAVEAVVTRCLAKSPDHRFQNVAQFAVALRDLAGPYGRASVERILMLAGGEEPAPPPSHAPLPFALAAPNAATGGAPLASASSVIRGTDAAWGETRPPATKSKRGSALLIASAIIVPLAGASAWWALRAHPDPGPSPDSSVGVVTGSEPAPSPPSPPLEAPPVLAPAPTLTPTPTPTPTTAPSEVAVIAATPAKPSVHPLTPPRKNVPAKPSMKPDSAPAPAPAPVAAPAAPIVATPTPTPTPTPKATATATEVKKPNGMGGRL